MEGPELSVVSVPDPELVKEITALLDRVGRSTGHAAVSEHKRTATVRAVDGSASGGASPRLVTGIVARWAGGPEVVGYAPVVGEPRTRQYAVEVAVDPNAGGGMLADALIDTAVGVVVRSGGGTLRLWPRGPTMIGRGPTGSGWSAA
jgi:hypothetical protein